MTTQEAISHAVRVELSGEGAYRTLALKGRGHDWSATPTGRVKAARWFRSMTGVPTRVFLAEIEAQLGL